MDADKNTDMNNRAMSALNGTKTERNLSDAFAGEAKAYTKYKLYADRAGSDGMPNAKRLFEDTADNEKEHAELWLGYLDGIGDTKDNLQDAIDGEDHEDRVMYPEMARTADDEGFGEIADKFRLAAQTEGHHRDTYKQLLDSMNNGTEYSGDENTNWKCTNCGFESRGNEPAARCQLCSYPREYFTRAN